MNRTHRLLVAALACSTVVVSVGAWPSPASAGDVHHKNKPPSVLLEELSSPKGLAVNGDGDPVVAEGFFGPPGPVLVFHGGKHGGTTEPVTDSFNVVDVAISPVDGTGWAIGGDAVLYHTLADGTIEPVLDIPGYQAGDPDPTDQEGVPDESNPYGLTVLRNGDVLVADAAGNDLIRVTPDGTPSTVARFDVEEVATDHLPFPFPDETVMAEAVPTTVVEGPDGHIYVGEPQGFPFRPGTSHIWRIDPAADGALCSVTTPDPDCGVYSDGFTSIQDIAFDPRKGTLFVYELAEEGALVFEEGFADGDFPPAVLLEVKHGKRTELAPGQLSEPGGIVVTAKGNVFVTDGVINDFAGRLVMIR